MTVESLGSSLRCEALSQPRATYVSWPSGRTSVIVTCTSVSTLVEEIQRSALAGPSVSTSCVSGVVVHASAPPGGTGLSHIRWLCPNTMPSSVPADGAGGREGSPASGGGGGGAPRPPR